MFALIVVVLFVVVIDNVVVVAHIVIADHFIWSIDIHLTLFRATVVVIVANVVVILVNVGVVDPFFVDDHIVKLQSLAKFSV